MSQDERESSFRPQISGGVPDFGKMHSRFQRVLESSKRANRPVKVKPFSFDRRSAAAEPKAEAAALFAEEAPQATRAKGNRPGQRARSQNARAKRKLAFKSTKKMEQLKKVRREQEEKFKERVRVAEAREAQRKARHQVRRAERRRQ